VTRTTPENRFASAAASMLVTCGGSIARRITPVFGSHQSK
jgi:hypothetical protein